MQIPVPSLNGVGPAVTRIAYEQEQRCGPKERGLIRGAIPAASCACECQSYRWNPRKKFVPNEPSRSLLVWYPIPEGFGLTGVKLTET